MPLTVPTLDDRRYQDLLDEALARIPVHNPEWTNFNKSDPGVTLVELFAFMMENLLYRANQIPERNRRKFLSLLGIPLNPAASAEGIVTLTNLRGPFQTVTLNAGIEVRAGQVPFRTEQGLDILPIEAAVYFKRKVDSPSQAVKDYYKQLYASFRGQPPSAELLLYETVPLSSAGAMGVDLGDESVDHSLWVALLRRTIDAPPREMSNDKSLESVRSEIAGKTLTVGVVPLLSSEDLSRVLSPGSLSAPPGSGSLSFELPSVPPDGKLSPDRSPKYQPVLSANAPEAPATFQVTLPSASELALWTDLDPLESGAQEFPPPLDDTGASDRLVTWIRIKWTGSLKARILWAGINATTVSQRTRVLGEILSTGTGQPDQTISLSRTPVIPGSVSLFITSPVITSPGGSFEKWDETVDLLSAGPEVPVPDLRLPPTTTPANDQPSKVYSLDPESGVISFGDGLHGARPAFGALLRADYDYGVGREGNVGAGSINTSPALPAGFAVNNPVRTWGGADAETTEDGERRIPRYLQHRERLVSTTDFQDITFRVPGVDVGRVDVVPAYNPELGSNEPGDSPGAVTLMIIPKFDSSQPDAPSPDKLFLDTICSYLDSRRLVTTEVFLRGPAYKTVWVSVGINVKAGASIADVREAVIQALKDFLSPLPVESDAIAGGEWPLRKAVVDLELTAVVNRVPGVLSVNKLLLAEGTSASATQIPMVGLELPRLARVSVTVGDPVDIDQLRGQGTVVTGQPVVPVPLVPEECK